MKIRLGSSTSGIALIMVLIVMLVLGILAGRFAYTMKVETKLARNASYDWEMEWMGRTGMEIAKFWLAGGQPGQGPPVDWSDPRWGVRCTTNHPLEMELHDPSHIPVGRGYISMAIEDNDRKFNINAVDENMLRGALATVVGVDAAQASGVADAILDWRDTDDHARLAGAESDVYQTADPQPYFAKNGPLDDLSELLMVRGIVPAMYWGSSGGGSRTMVFNRPASRSHFEEPVYLVGLKELFTTLSGNRVNINTATAQVLQVLPDFDENIANAIIGERANGADGFPGTPDDGYFRNVNELARVPALAPLFANPQASALLARFFHTQSLVFQVRVTAHIDSVSREYIGVLVRANPRNMGLASFYWR